MLKEGLYSDLVFSHHSVRKNFKEFLRHAIALATAFQLVFNGPKKRRSDNDSRRSGNKDDEGKSKKQNSMEDHPVVVSKDKGRPTRREICFVRGGRRKGLEYGTTSKTARTVPRKKIILYSRCAWKRRRRRDLRVLQDRRHLLPLAV